MIKQDLSRLWSKWPWNRCRARLEKKDASIVNSSYYGRCELKRHSFIDHALERGMITVRWSTHVWHE